MPRTPWWGWCGLVVDRIVVVSMSLQGSAMSHTFWGVGVLLVLGPLVPVGSQHLAVLPPLAYQPGSLPGASPHTGWVGNLILEQASRLDAFSGYPSRT